MKSQGIASIFPVLKTALRNLMKGIIMLEFLSTFVDTISTAIKELVDAAVTSSK